MTLKVEACCSDETMHGIVITSLVILYSVCEAEGLKLKNCNQTDVPKDLQEPIICEGISKNGPVVWHHQHKAVLGVCRADGTCSTHYSDYNITREGNSTVSQLRILKADKEDLGVVISCDDRESGTNDSCTLILKKVEISNCSSRKLIVFEDAPEAINCQNIPRNSGNVWLHLKDEGTEQVLGNCSAGGICSSKHNNQFNIKRDIQSTDSQVIILQRFRDLAGHQITCEDTLQKTRHTCLLVIRHHPVFSNCNISATCVNRTVSGSCFINNMFSSDNLYECVWTITDMNDNKKVEKVGDFGITKQRNNAYNCKECYRGTCSFAWKLPREKGNYSFTVIAIGSTKTAFSQVISNDHLCEAFSSGVPTVSQPSVSDRATTPSEESLPSEGNDHLVTIIVIVAVIALSIASITLFVIFRRRKKQNIRHDRQTSSGKQEEFEEHINDVYQCADLVTSQSNTNT